MSVRQNIPTLLVALATVLLSACATAPNHPSLQSATLPELVPVRRFVADIDYRGNFLLSPDGQRLIWSQPFGFDVGLAARNVDRAGDISTTPDQRFATGHLARPMDEMGNFGWLADSRHAYFYKDDSGAENTQIAIFDTRSVDFEPWLVTPWPDTRSFLLGAGAADSSRVLFASNRRDRSTFDVYEADFATRKIREIARSDGNVLSWMVDTDGRLIGRIRQLGREDGADRVAEIAIDSSESPATWRTIKKVGGFDWWHALRVERAQHRLYAFSNIDRDKAAVIEVNLDDGSERVLFEHPRVDAGLTLFSRRHGEPFAVTSTPDYPRIDYLDNAVGKEMRDAVEQALMLARKQGVIPADLVWARPGTISENRQRLIIKGFSATGNSELLFDRRTDTVTPLRTPSADASHVLAPMQPFSFRASDGLDIAGYVLRPKGVTEPAPLVINIHGGPWTRDYWSAGGFSTMQLLANRGYAVIEVNYRGSAGYGRKFMAAGARVTATRLQQDVAEAAQWAIDQRIADPKHIAVIGGSFGGFSTLMQLIDNPHQYACGVDLVGVANWPRIFDTWPSFWRNRHYFEWFYGNARDPVQREEMWHGSPLSRIDRITEPLLVIHGANDVRVLKQDSDEVVAELRKLGRPVDYLVFDNEGHQMRRWRNRLAAWRAIEDFLADCLGGRSAGFDYYQLMPR
ncbi:alpha/beta fold hydrolase [Noviherbaspirillum sp.]|uniref:alpha/beta hydrolase family protein n=1 Tax=Noviherbaspirillum sp. TaxID=1926288 RepID=UPI0025F6349C|nr:alpha/beta fold hydrolase [Noviherbaspirillum sp.]